MTKALPTLSTLGWVNTVEKKGDQLLSYFITSNYSQSKIYAGKIASLQYLVKTFGNDPLTLKSETTTVLEGMIRRAFSDAILVQVQVVEADETKPGQLTINLSCTITENGINYNLGRRVEFLDGVLSKIIVINNG